MVSYLSSYKPSESIVNPGVDDTGGIKYSVKDIEKEREFEKKKELMMQEFRKIDRDSSDAITLNEWLAFLEKQVSSLFYITQKCRLLESTSMLKRRRRDLQTTIWTRTNGSVCKSSSLVTCRMKNFASNRYRTARRWWKKLKSRSLTSNSS